MWRMVSRLRIPAAVSAVAILWAGALSAAAQPATQPTAGRPKVIIVPIQGPFYYQMAADEFRKIARGVAAQKPDAVVFVISSPGGSRNVSFAVAEQIADLPAKHIVALVSGEHGGAFGPAVFPLFACNHVFMAPQTTVDLASHTAAVNGQPDPIQDRLTLRQTSLLQSWSAQHHLSWSPIKDWLDAAGLLPEAEPAAGKALATAPSNRPVATSRPGLDVLKATRIEDLDEVLARLKLTGAWIITWPDPIARSNEQMQRIFQTADNLVKQTNDAIMAARDFDPRAQRYELRDISRQYTVGTIRAATQPTDARAIYQQTDTVTDHDLFADGGAAWRASSDRCIAQVKKAMESNRTLARLAARYPEVSMDGDELNESHGTLSAWLSQLRAERNRRSPP